jgi:hypothetical protein
MSRECKNCTSCCEFLSFEIEGKKCHPGSPCDYVDLGVGCSIHKNRPENPCRNYSCEWIQNDNIPLWFKPNLSKIIITRKYIDEVKYYLEISECDYPIDSKYLCWLFEYHLKTNIPLVVQVHTTYKEFGLDKIFIESSKNRVKYV